jgi:5-methylthioadenosine/S-adenosylhomocysteine deaminase
LKAKELAEKENVLLHFHLSETQKEVRDCLKEHGMRPAEYLHRLGVLSKKALCAHGVWLNEKECRLVGKTGASILHAPLSNLKLSVGSILPFAFLQKYGVRVALGTDGSASNNSLNLFECMKFASLLQKHVQQNPQALSAQETFKLATENGFRALGLNAGKIREGYLADFMLVNLKHVSFRPNHNLVSNIVYAASPECVDTVVCNGKILMQKRKIKDEEKTLEKAERQAFNWVAR